MVMLVRAGFEKRPSVQTNNQGNKANSTLIWAGIFEKINAKVMGWAHDPGACVNFRSETLVG